MASEFDSDELKNLAASPSEKLAQTINKIPSIAAMQAMEKAMRPSQELMRSFAELAEREQRMREQIAPLFYDSAKQLIEPMRSLQESMRPFTALAEKERQLQEQITPLLSNSVLSSLSKISAMAENPWLKNLGTSILRNWSSFSVAQSLSAQECIQRLASADKFLSTLRHANALVAPSGAPMPMPARFKKWESVPSEEQEPDVDGAERSVDMAIQSQNTQIQLLEECPASDTDRTASNTERYHAYGCQTVRNLHSVELKLNLPVTSSVCGEILPFDNSTSSQPSNEQMRELLTISKNILSTNVKKGLVVFRERGTQFVYDTACSPEILQAEAQLQVLLPYAGANIHWWPFILGAIKVLEKIDDLPEPKSLKGLRKLITCIIRISDICKLFLK